MNREHVTVRAEVRRDQDRTNYVVTWYVAGERRRASFSVETDANREADRIEAALKKGKTSMSPAMLKDVTGACLLRDQLCPEMSLRDIVRAFIRAEGQNPASVPIAVEKAGRAFIESRGDLKKFSKRHIDTVRNHINRFINEFEIRPLASISQEEIERHLNKTIGGCGKTQMQHLITLRSFFRWTRDHKQWIPYNKPTAPELVDKPKVSRTEHEVYTPEEFTRLLAFAPAPLVPFFVLGQFAGIRSEERMRLKWSHWRTEEDNKLVLTEDVTKTNRRRRIDVPPNLSEWLLFLHGRPEDPMVNYSFPFRHAQKVFKAACVRAKKNALRAGYASYHLELFDNPALTAKNDGHSVAELETSYKSISGVTKKLAKEMFDITPQSVLEYSKENNLPEPEWASCFLGITSYQTCIVQ